MIEVSEKFHDSEDRTWVTLGPLYNGKKYDLRVVSDKDGNDLLIADDELDNDIHPDEWGTRNEGFDPCNPAAAEEVYNCIFFFTDYNTFCQSDENLLLDMRAENPEWFE